MAVTISDEAILREFFRYDPETGLITWAKDHGKKIKAGDVAGSKARGRHIDLRVGDFRCKAHYAAWVLHHGRPPVGEIDHWNTVRTDNRIANLRDATRSQNGANKPRQRNNTSGYKGVSFFKQTGRWQAYINVDGARKHLGFFSTAVEAAAAYDAAASAEFGEFARLNLAPVLIEPDAALRPQTGGVTLVANSHAAEGLSAPFTHGGAPAPSAGTGGEVDRQPIEVAA